MTCFEAINIGTYFSTFNSGRIFRKYSEYFAISSNGELVAFSPADRIFII